MTYRLMLKELRESRGLRQEDLAQLLGVKLSTYRTWEQGTTGIRLDRACAICDVLHCTPNDLCGWYLSHPEDRPRGRDGPALTPAEAEVIDCYRASDPLQRDALSTYARERRAISEYRKSSSPASSEGAA